MAAEVAPLPLLKLPQGPSPISAEQRYWKSFNKNQLIPSPTNFPIVHISQASAVGDLFAITTGTRVQLYSSRTRKLVKTITRFGTVARSGEVRRDGRIVVAAEDTGQIQIFDINSRAILKTWTAHKQPVWTTKFSPSSLTTVLSTSDDKTVRLFDLASNDSTSIFSGHDDYVRSGAFLPGTTSNMVVSGSYDSTVKIWDSRSPGGAIMTFKHKNPIEDVLPLPSGTMILAASESHISVLDLVAAKPLQIITNHQKTVTSLSLASGGKRVVSGALDGHIKVFETSGWNCVAGAKYSSPILAARVITSGANGDDRHLAVGMASGVLSIQTRLAGPEAAKEREREKQMTALLAGTLDAYDKKQGKRKRRHNVSNRLDLIGEGADVVIAGNAGHRSKKETPWQKDLRHGRFASALDRVLDISSPHYSPLTVLTLLVALKHRSALRDALEGRDNDTVKPILTWVQKHISDTRYVGICTEISMHLLDMYSQYVDGSKELEDGFRLLHRRVTREVETAQIATQTGGMLGGLLVGLV